MGLKQGLKFDLFRKKKKKQNGKMMRPGIVADLCEFKTRLVYRVRSRTVRATQKCLSQKVEKKKRRGEKRGRGEERRERLVGGKKKLL